MAKGIWKKRTFVASVKNFEKVCSTRTTNETEKMSMGANAVTFLGSKTRVIHENRQKLTN